MTTPNTSTTPTPDSSLGGIYGQQAAGLGQARDILARQYGQAQLLQPGMFNLAGVTPAAGGGYDIAPTENNPQLAQQWRTAELNLNETLRKQFGPGYQSSTGAAQTLSDFQAKKIQSLEADRRAYEQQRLGEIQGISQMPLAGTTALGSTLSGGYSNMASEILRQQLTDAQVRMEQQRLSAQANQGLWGGVGNLLGGILGRGGTGAGGGISGTIGDIFGIPGAIYKGAQNLGNLFGFNGGSAPAAGTGPATGAAGQGSGGISGMIGDLTSIPGSIYSGIQNLGSLFAGPLSAPATTLPATGALTTSAPEILSGVGSALSPAASLGADFGPTMAELAAEWGGTTAAGAGEAAGAAGGALGGILPALGPIAAIGAPLFAGLMANMNENKMDQIYREQAQSAANYLTQNPQHLSTIEQNLTQGAQAIGKLPQSSWYDPGANALIQGISSPGSFLDKAGYGNPMKGTPLEGMGFTGDWAHLISHFPTLQNAWGQVGTAVNNLWGTLPPRSFIGGAGGLQPGVDIGR